MLYSYILKIKLQVREFCVVITATSLIDALNIYSIRYKGVIDMTVDNSEFIDVKIESTNPLRDEGIWTSDLSKLTEHYFF